MSCVEIVDAIVENYTVDELASIAIGYKYLYDAIGNERFIIIMGMLHEHLAKLTPKEQGE